MNHIHRLQNDIIERDRVLTERLERMWEFRVHLNTPKFINTDGSEERNDLIAVADVLRWLNYIEHG